MQRRLAGAGYPPGDEAGRFGPETEKSVLAFQESRGLHADGVVGPQTWGALVEAGYRLGDRLLYLRSPYLRGDDVDELQRRLDALGFDVGRLDGILGPETATALEDFQRNAGLTTDAICGPATVVELKRLSGKVGEPGFAGHLREQESLRRAPRTLSGRRVVVGEPGGLEVLAGALDRALHRRGAVVLDLHEPDWSTQAAEANRFAAEVYVGLELADEGCRAAYYAKGEFESAGGRRLAERIQEAVGGVLGEEPQDPRGMGLPILRETRMPAVLCRLGPPPVIVTKGPELAGALAGALSVWARSPVDG